MYRAFYVRVILIKVQKGELEKPESGQGGNIKSPGHDTSCLVRRDNGEVLIERYYYGGDGFVVIKGLTPNHDYLFRIDSAKMCE